MATKTETINLTVIDVCENTVTKDGLNGLFSKGTPIEAQKISNLGAGSQGLVFKISIGEGMFFALKEDRDDTKYRSLSEFKTLCLLHSEPTLKQQDQPTLQPFFVKPYCLVSYKSESESFNGMVMELLECYTPLQSFIDQGNKLRLMVLDSLVSTFTICDKEGFVHGDLNPGNIMVSVIGERGVVIKFIDTNCGLPMNDDRKKERQANEEAIIAEIERIASEETEREEQTTLHRNFFNYGPEHSQPVLTRPNSSVTNSTSKYQKTCNVYATPEFSSPIYLRNLSLPSMNDKIIQSNYTFGKLILVLSLFFGSSLLSETNLSLFTEKEIPKDPIAFSFFISENPNLIKTIIESKVAELKTPANSSQLEQITINYIERLLVEVLGILDGDIADLKTRVEPNPALPSAPNPAEKVSTALNGILQRRTSPTSPNFYPFKKRPSEKGSHKGGARKSKSKKNKKKTINKTRTMKRKKRTIKKAKKIVNRKKK